MANLFYPETCSCCNGELSKHENTVCTGCIHDLPLTNYHLTPDNPVTKTFYGRASIENGTSLLFFRKKGMVQNLIHNLKYRGHEEVGSFLGNWMGSLLQENASFQDIDAVVPVPLHKRKLKTRGYNQVEQFARKIALKLDAQYLENVLVKRSPTGTQTLKNRLSRWGNMEEIFLLQNTELLENKHVLLVDDIITTGATLEACTNKLKQINGVRVSIATMAFTA
ncbi:ComF family protein [Autumnicola musiva]|uniref:ComF family protein n=1 Tax=Autumnicola musiva TaxID=3075589 RepID=A0ABU3D9S7_9FLAO|nr:ComF family protein [Zunongwangia sp. F117]MDT0677733.1 ComF family protein [Zunongwangia sp. F117]